MRYRIAISIWTVSLVSLAVSSPARAGGYEFPGEGTRGLGRGGAFAARADDPTAVVVNPAGLASMPGVQLWASFGMLFADNCFERNQPGLASDGTPTAPAWNPEWGTDASGNRIGYTKVCNEKSKQFTPIPALGVSWHFSKKAGFGFFASATNSERAQAWGNRSYTPTGQQQGFGGYVDAPPGSQGSDPSDPSVDRLIPLNNGERLLPASSRFMLVNRRVDLYYLTAAVGAKPLHWLQIGAAFGWGIAGVDFTYNVRYGSSGEEPSTSEGQTSLHQARDLFVPRVIASLHFIPHKTLDIVTVFRWEDAIKARGDVQSTPNANDTPQPTYAPLDGRATFTMPRPWWLTFGIRYANRVAPRPDDPDVEGREAGWVDDSMAHERFDIEANVVYERNRLVDSFSLNLDNEAFDTIKIGHNWQDQLSVRLGGDVNTIPDTLALRWGLSYETSGFTSIRVSDRKKSSGGTIDFMPGQRFGLHLGLSGRWACKRDHTRRPRRLELSAAFAYFWMTTHNNDNGGTQQILVSDNPEALGDTVNNGAYSSRYIVASLAFRYIFRP